MQAQECRGARSVRGALCARPINKNPSSLLRTDEARTNWRAVFGGHGRIRTADKGFADPRLNHLATWPLERETGFEPATFSLARRRATTAPLPHCCVEGLRLRFLNYTPDLSLVSTSPRQSLLY